MVRQRGCRLKAERLVECAGSTDRTTCFRSVEVRLRHAEVVAGGGNGRLRPRSSTRPRSLLWGVPRRLGAGTVDGQCGPARQGCCRVRPGRGTQGPRRGSRRDHPDSMHRTEPAGVDAVHRGENQASQTRGTPMSSLTLRAPRPTSLSSLLTWPLSCCVSCSCLAAAAGADKGRLPRRGGSTCLLSAARPQEKVSRERIHMIPQQQPSGMPFHRYQPFKPVDLPDRTWPSKTITKAPR